MRCRRIEPSDRVGVRLGEPQRAIGAYGDVFGDRARRDWELAEGAASREAVNLVALGEPQRSVRPDNDVFRIEGRNRILADSA